MTLLELLTSGRIEEFNAKRGQRVTLDFFAADFSGMNLANADLSGANLEKADLSGADLTGAVLAKANLCGADLTGAKLGDVVAIRARLREAYLGNATADGAEFSGADFTEADLTGFRAVGGRFAGSRFKEAVLANAVLTNADLSECKLGDADLRAADLSGAKLVNAEMARANATGARLVGALLTGARLAGSVLKNAVLARADLTGADLSGVDLTGADLSDANFERADLFEATVDAEAMKAAKAPVGFAEPPVAATPDDAVELHFDDPSVAAYGTATAVLWENADADDVDTLRILVTRSPAAISTGSKAIAIPIEQVLARYVLPSKNGFECALFLDRPAGFELMVMSVDRQGNVGAPRSVRLGYTPVVKPVMVPEDESFLVYGIGRQGALSVHRFDGTALVELMRAPANTYRGFCGRLDPVLLGKGGTVAPVLPDGIGRLQSAPSGYPGRLTAAAHAPGGEQIALAWVGKNEKGVRFQHLGVDTESVRFDTGHEVGSLDLRSVGTRWLLVYTRESAKDTDSTLPMAVWLPGGKPFALLAGDDVIDIEDVRLLPGKEPRVAMVTLGEDVLVADVGESSATLRARLGAMAFA